MRFIPERRGNVIKRCAGMVRKGREDGRRREFELGKARMGIAKGGRMW